VPLHVQHMSTKGTGMSGRAIPHHVHDCTAPCLPCSYISKQLHRSRRLITEHTYTEVSVVWPHVPAGPLAWLTAVCTSKTSSTVTYTCMVEHVQREAPCFLTTVSRSKTLQVCLYASIQRRQLLGPEDAPPPVLAAQLHPGSTMSISATTCLYHGGTTPSRCTGLGSLDPPWAPPPRSLAPAGKG
jgi:hypothetical protein